MAEYKRILAIDTATEACSVALLVDGHVHELFEATAREHALRLLPMVDAVLAQGQCTLRSLDAIAYGRGPGSFTGVRIAAAAAQGLAYGADLPVVGISTLRALARDAALSAPADYIAAAIDARMGEVYWGVYAAQPQAPLSSTDECVCAPAAVPWPAQGGRYIAVGSGWAAHGAALSAALSARYAAVSVAAFDTALPRAQAVAWLAADALAAGAALLPDQALPVYLRDQVALTEAQRKAP